MGPPRVEHASTLRIASEGVDLGFRPRLRPIMSDPIRPETHPDSPSLRDILLAEFDAERTALIEPNMVVSQRDIPRPPVMCFFSEVIEGIARRGDARQVAELRGADGVHPIWEIAVRTAIPESTRLFPE
jgi:hypothetical protein